MSKMMEAALCYAIGGWPVFPVRANRKEPLTTNGVHNATTNLNQIHRWWTEHPEANIGFNLGAAGMMAYDLDPGSSLVQLTKDVGGLAETYVQDTPRGGSHLLYRLPDGLKVAPSTAKVSPHVDIRSYGSYILLAPSETKHGVYENLNPEIPIADATAEMLHTAALAREKHPERDTWIIKPDLPENINAAKAWLRGETEVKGKICEIAVEGVNGDHMAYATACMMRSYGLSEPIALDLMIEVWDPRNDPPWGAEADDFFRVKIDNAYGMYATSPPGNMTDAYRAAKQAEAFEARKVGDGMEWQEGPFRTVDLAGLEAIPDVTWLVPGFLPSEGYAILFGAYGTYKTFLAVDLACSIAADQVNTYWPIGEHGPTIFMAGEGRSGIKQRVKAWALHHEARPVDLYLTDPVPMLSMDEAVMDAYIDQALELHPEGYKLVVLDTVGRAMAGGNENSQEDAAKFTALVSKMIKRLGCTVLALHHSGYGDAGRTRGSSVFSADADTVVRADADGAIVELTMTKQKDAAAWPKPKVARLAKKGDSLVVVAPLPGDVARSQADRDDQAQRDTIVRYALAALRSRPVKTWSIAALARQMRELKCSDNLNTLKSMLGNTDRGWCRHHPALIPYRNQVSQVWETPAKLPPLELKYALTVVE